MGFWFVTTVLKCYNINYLSARPRAGNPNSQKKGRVGKKKDASNKSVTELGIEYRFSDSQSSARTALPPYSAGSLTEISRPPC